MRGAVPYSLRRKKSWASFFCLQNDDPIVIAASDINLSGLDARDLRFSQVEKTVPVVFGIVGSDLRKALPAELLKVCGRTTLVAFTTIRVQGPHGDKARPATDGFSTDSKRQGLPNFDNSPGSRIDEDGIKEVFPIFSA
jgi:hypothetical protein